MYKKKDGSKIMTNKDELLRYLLYNSTCSEKICVGIIGDVDIRDSMSKKLQGDVMKLLKGKYN